MCNWLSMNDHEPIFHLGSISCFNFALLWLPNYFLIFVLLLLDIYCEKKYYKIFTVYKASPVGEINATHKVSKDFGLSDLAIALKKLQSHNTNKI